MLEVASIPEPRIWEASKTLHTQCVVLATGMASGRLLVDGMDEDGEFIRSAGIYDRENDDIEFALGSISYRYRNGQFSGLDVGLHSTEEERFFLAVDGTFSYKKNDSLLPMGWLRSHRLSSKLSAYDIDEYPEIRAHQLSEQS